MHMNIRGTIATAGGIIRAELCGEGGERFGVWTLGTSLDPYPPLFPLPVVPRLARALEIRDVAYVCWLVV